MSVYAFDGTWNEAKDGDDPDYTNTNVSRFFNAYKQHSKRPDLDFYVPGVGTRFQAIGRALGGVFGLGELPRINLGLVQDRELNIRGTLMYQHEDYERAVELIESGAVCTYGPQLEASYKRIAYYVDRILKGAKPADLPVQEPTKYELVFNLKSAKAIGLTVPPSLLSRADELIE